MRFFPRPPEAVPRGWTNPFFLPILWTMQRFLILLVVAVPLAFGSGCRQQDLRTVTITLTGVTGEADIRSISNAVAVLEGVFDETIVFPGTGSVQLKYDSMKLARKNIEYAIAGAGFGANEIPAKRDGETVPQPRRLP